MAFPLRDYQRETLGAIFSAYQRGVRRQVISLPPGSGKTIVIAHLIAQRDGRAIILEHRDELITQAREKLQMIAPWLPVGVVQGRRNDILSQCVIASVQTISRKNRLSSLQKEFRTVIVDEAHHATASTYRRVLEHVGVFNERGPLTVGVTATPRRSDKQSLDAVFQEVVYHRSVGELIRAGFLCDLRALQVGVAADFDGLRTKSGDFLDEELETCLLRAEAPAVAVRAFLQYATERKAVVFTPTVRFSRVATRAFVCAGVVAEAIDSQTPRVERRKILARFRDGTTRVLVNCGVLTEGYDEPSVGCIVICRPTKSAPLFMQMLGRGMRPFPGKADCLILDLVGATARHSLQTVGSIVGLPDGALTGNTSVREAFASCMHREESPQLRDHLLEKEANLFRRGRSHWLQYDKLFVLAAGERGWVAVTCAPSPDPDYAWKVMSVPKRARAQITVIKDNLSPGAARRLAEGLAREYAPSLVDSTAQWRRELATASQLKMLRNMEVVTEATVSRGRASDLITLSMFLSRFLPQGKA